MNSSRLVGIVYNALVPQAEEMAKALQEHLGLGEEGWVRPAAEVESAADLAKETRLIITVGGDGTILRAAKLSVPYEVPMLGINLGRLGFMTELKVEEALDKVPHYLDGDTWVEERSMLQVHPRIQGSHESAQKGSVPSSTYHALNDVVLGRGAVARLVRIRAVIDGEHLTTYGADAVIIATATGSTGYNLSVGGPILDPRSADFILKPVAPHLGLAPGLVLPSTSVVELTVETEHQAMLSVDGYVDLPLAAGDGVMIQQSPHKARFLRAYPPTHYYATLTRRLGFGQGGEGVRGIEY